MPEGRYQAFDGHEVMYSQANCTDPYFRVGRLEGASRVLDRQPCARFMFAKLKKSWQQRLLSVTAKTTAPPAAAGKNHSERTRRLASARESWRCCEPAVVQQPVGTHLCRVEQTATTLADSMDQSANRMTMRV